jgi:cobalamin biosynthesis protein CobD/CbiB
MIEIRDTLIKILGSIDLQGYDIDLISWLLKILELVFLFLGFLIGIILALLLMLINLLGLTGIILSLLLALLIKLMKRFKQKEKVEAKKKNEDKETSKPKEIVNEPDKTMSKQEILDKVIETKEKSLNIKSNKKK